MVFWPIDFKYNKGHAFNKRNSLRFFHRWIWKGFCIESHADRIFAATDTSCITGFFKLIVAIKTKQSRSGINGEANVYIDVFLELLIWVP